MFFSHDTHPLFRILAAAIFAAAVVSGAHSCAVSAGAQGRDAPPVEVSPATLMLARSCVSERSWRTDTTDCRAIAAVVLSRMAARGGTFEESMRALAPRLHGGTITGRLWLLDLSADATRPARLRGARWEGLRRDAWIETMREAQRTIAAIDRGDFVSPCADAPRAWGSRADVARRLARGFRFVAVDCGDAVNLYGRLFSPRTPSGLDAVPASP